MTGARRAVVVGQLPPLNDGPKACVPSTAALGRVNWTCRCHRKPLVTATCSARQSQLDCEIRRIQRSNRAIAEMAGRSAARCRRLPVGTIAIRAERGAPAQASRPRIQVEEHSMSKEFTRAGRNGSVSNIASASDGDQGPGTGGPFDAARRFVRIGQVAEKDLV